MIIQSKIFLAHNVMITTNKNSHGLQMHQFPEIKEIAKSLYETLGTEKKLEKNSIHRPR